MGGGGGAIKRQVVGRDRGIISDQMDSKRCCHG